MIFHLLSLPQPGSLLSFVGRCEKRHSIGAQTVHVLSPISVYTLVVHMPSSSASLNLNCSVSKWERTMPTSEGCIRGIKCERLG